MTQLYKVSRVAGLVLAAGMATGCATITQEQFDAVAATASTALEEARGARLTADGAVAMASDSMAAAQAAQATADAAVRCCDSNTSKLDRMFSEKMKK